MSFPIVFWHRKGRNKKHYGEHLTNFFSLTLHCAYDNIAMQRYKTFVDYTKHLAQNVLLACVFLQFVTIGYV